MNHAVFSFAVDHHSIVQSYLQQQEVCIYRQVRSQYFFDINSWFNIDSVIIDGLLPKVPNHIAQWKLPYLGLFSDFRHGFPRIFWHQHAANCSINSIRPLRLFLRSPTSLLFCNWGYSASFLQGMCSLLIHRLCQRIFCMLHIYSLILCRFVPWIECQQ